MRKNRRRKIDLSNKNQAYWDRILDQEGFSMERGGRGDIRQTIAILIYLEGLDKIKEKDVMKGFQIVKEE